MKVLDLFSGIGGFSLGLERAGFKTAAFCEVNPVCRQVLKNHWPQVPIYDDVQTLTAQRLADDGVYFDVICGGFPCQDISVAGRGAGLAGERSGLWYEYHRLIEETRPRYVIIENVAALRSRGLDEVLRCLTALRYDAEWHCIPASAIGAPHRRDRIWIVAYANNNGRDSTKDCESNYKRDGRSAAGQDIASQSSRSSHRGQDVCGSTSKAVANAASVGSQGSGQPIQPCYPTPLIEGEAVKSQHGRVAGFWATEPDVGRVAHGVSGRVDRLKQLGNAVVPQIPEMIGRAILAYENALG